MPLVYDELRRLAAGYLRRERAGQTLQATALVNEAYIRLVREKARGFQNRAHFLAIAALSMRQILIQRARARKAAKRGAAPQRVTLTDGAMVASARGGEKPLDADELLALDEALSRLAELDAQLARVVECRYFGGLTVEETAEALGSSPATVKRQWSLARAWLRRELDRTPP